MDVRGMRLTRFTYEFIDDLIRCHTVDSASLENVKECALKWHFRTPDDAKLYNEDTKQRPRGEQKRERREDDEFLRSPDPVSPPAPKRRAPPRKRGPAGVAADEATGAEVEAEDAVVDAPTAPAALSAVAPAWNANQSVEFSEVPKILREQMESALDGVARRGSMASSATPDSALCVKPEWLVKILRREKTVELRSRRSNKAGKRVGLICCKTGLVYGECYFVSCEGPVDDGRLLALQPFHCVRARTDGVRRPVSASSRERREPRLHRPPTRRSSCARASGTPTATRGRCGTR